MLPFDTIARIVLPSPISTNTLYNNVRGRGRVMTKDYKQWKKTAAEMIQAQAPLPRFVTPVEITLYVGEKGVGDMDSDNTAKAYLDALVAAKIIPEDKRKWLRRSSPEWVPDMRGCVAVIEPASPPALAKDIIATIRPGLRSLLT